MSYLSNLPPEKFEDFCLRLLKAQGFSEISSDVLVTPDIRADFTAKDQDGALTVIEIKQTKDINVLNKTLFQVVSIQKLRNTARAIVIIPQKAPNKILDVSKGLGVEVWDDIFIQNVVERFPKFFGPVEQENAHPGEISLKSIDLLGFRGIKDLHLEFSPVTVLVGKNGAGKSSILDAIAIGLSWFSQHMANLRRNGLPIAISDINLDENVAEAMINLTAILEGDQISWEIVRAKPDHFQTRRSKFRELDNKINEILGSYISPDEKLPLVAYYSAHRTIKKVVVEPQDGSASRVSDLYKNAIEGDHQNFQGFFEWFRKQEDRENQLRKEENPDYRDTQLGIVRKAVLGILGEFSELSIDRSSDPARMIAVKGRDRLEVGQLSDGEKCLLGMVGDLARRLAIANPNKSINPLNGYGIVLIDEIELHLHPQLQRNIIGYLTNIFPNCQFVISTHSAPIVSHVKDFPLILLENINGEINYRSFQAYGQDINSVLGNIFEMEERPEDVQKELDAISEFIDQDRYKDADEKLKTLSSKIGENDPEIVRLESLIHFLSD